MRRLPSISTRTYTLFPYPTLVRSPEDLVEGRAVRDVEEAERADLPVQLDGVDARAERAGGDSPLVDPGDVIDGGHVEVPDRLGTVQVLAMVDVLDHHHADRSEEHTSELQSLMRISYAVFCLQKKITKQTIL